MRCAQGNEIFLTKVTAWQRQLGLVDASLSTWQDAQKLWQALESIYIGSEDIQKQLPQDSQRFNTINGQFKVTTKCSKTTSSLTCQLTLPGTQSADSACSATSAENSIATHCRN